MVIHGDIVVNIIRIWSTKSTISQKIKTAKIGKLLFHRFQNIAHILGQKKWATFGHLWRYFGKFSNHFEYKIEHFSKNKSRIDRKIVFSEIVQSNMAEGHIAIEDAQCADIAHLLFQYDHF